MKSERALSKLTKASKGSACIRCGVDGAYSCHYNGTFQHAYGKGMGKKCHDLATAEFCFNCDRVFSEGTSIYKNSIERDQMFFHYIMLTNIRRFENGVLKT